MLRVLSCGLVLVGAIAVVCAVPLMVLSAPEPAPAEAPADKPPAPLSEQSYTGTDHCLECHRDQVKSWSVTKHAQAYSRMPAKYQQDPACLKCHVTAYGKPTGYVAGGSKDLVEVGCEACHGPGALHENAALRFRFATPAEEKKLEKEMKETIVRTASDKVCAACHVTQGHRPHPAYEGQPLRTTVVSGPAVPCGATIPAPCGLGGGVAAVWPAPRRPSIKACGACHYGEYRHWGSGEHAHLDAKLTAPYRTNQECLSCHPQGTGAAAIATTGADAPPAATFIDASCESCHGPGREHVRFNMQFVAGPRLGPALEQASRQTIRQAKPANTCMACHVRHGHKEHPQYEAGK